MSHPVSLKNIYNSLIKYNINVIQYCIYNEIMTKEGFEEKPVHPAQAGTPLIGQVEIDWLPKLIEPIFYLFV